MSKMAAKGLRIIVIFAVAATLFFVGWRFGPGAPPADAAIFERLNALWPAIPAFTGTPGKFSPPRDVVMNGSRLQYSVGHVEASFHDVLDFYTKLYEVGSGRIVPPGEMEKLKGVSDPKARELVDEVERVDRFMSRFAGRAFRHEGRNGGFVAILDPGPAERGDWGERLKKRLEGFRRTGRLGDLGTGKVVFVQGEGERRSAVLTIWLDKDFSMQSLKGKRGEDLPGSDAPDVPRYPGSTRLLSLAEKGEAWRTHTLIYESGDDLTSQYLHFKSQMKVQGWEEAVLPDSAAPAGSRVLVFVKEKEQKECAVTLQEDPKRGGAKTVVVYRIGHS